MQTDQNKALIRAFVDAMNARDWQALRGVVAPDFVRHSHAAGDPPVRNREDLEGFLEGEFDTFPDASETVEELIAEGDRVAARHRFRGTQLGEMGHYPASMRAVDAAYIAIYRVENGRIAEAWVEWDNLTALRQLGHYHHAVR